MGQEDFDHSGASPESAEYPYYISILHFPSLNRLLAENGRTTDTVNGAGIMAMHFFERGDLKSAQLYFSAACVLCEWVCGQDDPLLSTCRHNLAGCDFLAGRKYQAIALEKLVLEESMRIHGPDSPPVQEIRKHLQHWEQEGDKLIASTRANTLQLSPEVLTHLHRDLRLLVATTPSTLDFAFHMAGEGRRAHAAGRFQEAACLAAFSFLTFEALAGPTDRQALASRSDMAEAYRLGGYIHESLGVHAAVLKDSIESLGESSEETLITQNNYAEALKDSGHIYEALCEHRRVLEIRERTLPRNHEHVLHSRANVTTCLRLAGMFKEEIEEQTRLLEQVHEVHGATHLRAIITRHNLLIASVHVDPAPDVFERLVALAQEAAVVLGDDHIESLKIQANVLTLQSAVSDAIEIIIRGFMSILKIVQSQTGIDRRPFELHLRCRVAELMRKSGRAENACKLYAQAIRDAKRHLGSEAVITLEAQLGLADSLEQAGRSPEAESLLTHMLDQILKNRNITGSAVDKGFAGETLSLPVAAMFLASLRARMNQGAARVFQALEAGTARALLDLLMFPQVDRRSAGRQLVAQGKWTPRQLATYESHLTRWAEIQQEEQVYTQYNVSHDAPNRRRLAREAARVQEKLAATERDLLPVSEPKSLEEVRQHLQRGEVLIVYGWCNVGVSCVVAPAASDGEPQAFSISEVSSAPGEDPVANSNREREAIGAIEAIAKVIREGVLSASRSSDLAQAARELLDFAMPLKVRSLLAKATRVVVVPSGPLNDLPLEMVADIAGVQEVAGKPVTTAPSGSIFAMLRDRRRRSVQTSERATLRPCIVGDPDFGLCEPFNGPARGAGKSKSPSQDRTRISALDHLVRDGVALARLPYAEVEARAIAGYYAQVAGAEGGIRPLLDKEATVSRVYDDAKGKHVVHFAAHAILGEISDPMKSAVVLAAERGPKGRLSAGYLSVATLVTHWPHRLAGTDLVILNCCDTGRGVRLGDSHLGLPIAILNAGCQAVVASLWEVGDLPTCLLMTRFHQNYLGHHVTVSKEPDTIAREIWGGSYRSGEPMAVSEALAEAKKWLSTLMVPDVDRFRKFHPLLPPSSSGSDGPQRLRASARGGTSATALQRRLSEADRRKLPPFGSPVDFAAFVVIGDA